MTIKPLFFQNAVVATGNGVPFRSEDAAGIVVEIKGTFVGTLTFEGTMDYSIPGSATYNAVQAVNLGTLTKSTTATAPGVYYVPSAGLDAIRCRVSAYTSGSITAIGRRTNSGSPAIIDAVLETGDIELGAVEIKDGTTDNRTAVTTPTDAFAAPGATVLETMDFLMVYNGTTHDRVKSANAAKTTTGTGLLGVGNLVFDGTNWQAVTTVGDNSDAQANSATGDQKTVSRNFGYNGATWDRMRTGDVNNVAAATGFQDSLTVGRYNATLPTLTDTRFNSLQVGLRGGLHVDLYNADGTAALFPASAAVADAAAIPTTTTVRSLLASYNATPTADTVRSANSDAQAATGILAAGNMGYNGATFDRLRSGAVTNVAAATGFLDALAVGQYVATPPSITANQYQHMLLDLKGSQRVTLMDKDATTQLFPVTAATADALANPTVTNIGALNLGFNGTTYDRLRSGATNADAIATATLGSLSTQAYQLLWNGTTWDRAQSAASSGAGLGVAKVAPAATGVAALAPTNDNGVAAVASRVVKASAGTLYGISLWNNNAAKRYLQLFDSASVPADTTVPLITVPIAADGFQRIDFGTYGRRFATGIAVCNSTTGATKTIGSADSFIDAQFV